MPIIKTSVTQQVMEYIKERIADGTWRVGEKIPSENELAGELGASRTSIRLAIRQYIAIGVLESAHGKGTYLKTATLDAFFQPAAHISEADCLDVIKVLEFRLIVEPEASFLAAERATPEDIENLARHVEGLRASFGDVGAYLEHDMAFHAAVGRASGNPLLEKSLLTVFEQTRKNFKQLIEIFRFKMGAMYHPLILGAIGKRDSRLARRLMKEHLKKALEELLNKEK